MNIKKLFAMCAIMFVSNGAIATEILPVSYSFDQATDTGSYNYSDWGGVQLTDGEYGTAPWSADLGNGPAYEWLGWRDSSINMDFDFGNSELVNSISIGTVQDNINDVVVPDLHLYTSADGIIWSLISSIITSESSSNNNTYFTKTFDNLSLNSQYFRINASYNTNGPWIFIDEVDFFQTNDIPEPATLALLGLGLAGIGYKRKKTHS